MGVFANLEEARKYFELDRFATENGVRLEEIGEGRAVCSLELGERHRNADGGVMGGAIFTLADLAFAAASNSIYRLTVAQQVSVSFLSGSRGQALQAEAVCRKDGKTSCVYNVNVRDDLGRDIAQIVFTGYKVPKKDEP